ncbi:OsmC family protein [Amphritea sp. 1_MG-2023]|uniref:OsmC family protein n=1 Tax=Amphritea sp. 1_MG-2023 TaxID=3062670 RepID=UPI0026E488FE|nr:OsmC family protein [Amphritea sp. 1_MG-2023]MDO6564400.1 OsmC family protein [Amphritea sp. 1_MG-2023]
MSKKMTFKVVANRTDAHGSTVACKDALLIADTDLQGRVDAFNPAELLMSALAACIIKGIERVTPILKFDLQQIEVTITGVRQDAPPKMESIYYTIKVTTTESDHRLDLLHDNVKKFGTVFNTIAPGTDLTGILIRA